MITPHRGQRFVHPRFLTEVPGVPARGWPHEVREVTSVTATAVYHRPAGSTGRATHRCSREWFAEHVTEILEG